MVQELVEVRSIQRIMASREGRPAFWLLRGEDRLPLYDLSLEGFAVSGAQGFVRGVRTAFCIARAGSGQAVCGEAEAVNQFGGEQGRTGFRIVSVAAEDQRRLHAWLAEHVLDCAGVPISEADAAAVVAGRSII